MNVLNNGAPKTGNVRVCVESPELLHNFNLPFITVSMLIL